MSNTKKIPEDLQKQWDNREKAIVFSTVSEKGVPNSIYATCVSRYNDYTFLVANNFFDKTLKNIASGCKGVLLFITKDEKSFQLKGTVKYFTSGNEFENMKKWNPAKLSGHGVAVLNIEEVYNGAEKLF